MFSKQSQKAFSIMMMSLLVKNVFRFLPNKRINKAMSTSLVPFTHSHIRTQLYSLKACIVTHIKHHIDTHIHGWRSLRVCDSSQMNKQGGYQGPSDWLAYSRQLPARKSLWHHFTSLFLFNAHTHTQPATCTQKWIYIRTHTRL